MYMHNYNINLMNKDKVRWKINRLFLLIVISGFSKLEIIRLTNILTY